MLQCSQDIEIGVLVNNVGLSYEHPQEFLELDSTYVEAMVNVNIVSLNAMTRHGLLYYLFSINF